MKRFRFVVMWGAVFLVAVAPAFGAKPKPQSDAVGHARADSARSRAPAPVRTLDAITIEGEIPLPQILFIAMHDVPRYPDEIHRRFVRTGLEVGRGAFLPLRLYVSPAIFRERPAVAARPARGPQE